MLSLCEIVIEVIEVVIKLPSGIYSQRNSGIVYCMERAKTIGQSLIA